MDQLDVEFKLNFLMESSPFLSWKAQIPELSGIHTWKLGKATP